MTETAGPTATPATATGRPAGPMRPGRRSGGATSGDPGVVPPQDGPAPAVGGRVAAIDLARALAILGMLTVHFGPYGLGGATVAERLYGAFYGKASVLFVVVAGTGVGLMLQRSPTGQVRTRLLYRAVWLIPLGLWLQTLDHPVAVILQYYGLYFLVLSAFVGLGPRAIAAWATVWWLTGATAVLLVRQWAPDWLLTERGDPPLGVAGDLVIGGYYPLLTWMAPMLIGVLLARLDLRRARVGAGLVVAGSATLGLTVLGSRGLLAVLDAEAVEGSWWFALSTRGHSEMPLAVLGATGAAVAVVGLSALAVLRAGRLVAPLVAAGRLALTIYVGHLLVFHRWPDLFPVETVGSGVWKIAVFAAVTSVFSVAWLAAFERGPLEAAVRWPWQRLIQPRLRTRTESTPPVPDPHTGS